MLVFRGGRRIGQQGGKIVGKNKGVFVLRIAHTSRPFVAGAQVAGGVVLRTGFEGGFFNLPLPGPFGAMRRNQYPLAGEWIVSAV